MVEEDCPSGYYCPEGVINPIKCRAGTYSSGSGYSKESECTAVAAGSYTAK
jgi:hypothetical protein